MSKSNTQEALIIMRHSHVFKDSLRITMTLVNHYDLESHQMSEKCFFFFFSKWEFKRKSTYGSSNTRKTTYVLQIKEVNTLT